MRELGEALRFVQTMVNNKDRSGIREHTAVTQTHTDAAIVSDQVQFTCHELRKCFVACDFVFFTQAELYFIEGF